MSDERIPIEFTCPTCGDHRMEEVMVDCGVLSGISLTQNPDGSDVDFDYGQQSNEDGHVDRYQCIGCGYTILADTPEFSRFTQGGLDHHALAAAIKWMNEIREPVKKGDLVDAGELVTRISDQYATLSGQELANEWNRLFPEQVVYEGDSLFWVKE